MERVAAAVGLSREIGLRSREAFLTDAKRVLRKARTQAVIFIRDGTKGGRGQREIPIHSERMLKALENAAKIQGSHRSLIPAAETWAQWREGGLRDGREALQDMGIANYQDLRAAYACERYQTITGHPAPVLGGRIMDRDLDRLAREVIRRELGHKSADIAAAYVGGRQQTRTE